MFSFPEVRALSYWSYAKDPCLMMNEATSRFIGFPCVVSFEARESRTNWKFVFSFSAVLYRESCGVNSCADVMFTFPSSKSTMSIFAAILAALSISFPFWSSMTTSSMMILFSMPRSMFPTVTLEPILSAMALATVFPMVCCTRGICSMMATKIYKVTIVQTTMLVKCFMMLLNLFNFGISSLQMLLLFVYFATKLQKKAQLVSFLV